MTTKEGVAITMVATVISLASVIVFIGAVKVYKSVTTPYQCADKRVVAEIVSVAYRTSTFRDTQGNLVSLDQATYKVGSEICLKQERVK